MNKAAAARFIAGMTTRWVGVDPDKPKGGEREILDRFGSNVMLAWDVLEDELRQLREEKAARKAAK